VFHEVTKKGIKGEGRFHHIEEITDTEKESTIIRKTGDSVTENFFATSAYWRMVPGMPMSE
jgi:hypothetical protein